MAATRHPRRTILIGAGALAVLAGAVPAGAVPAAAATSVPAARYSFRTLDNSHDRTFNQLLGINSHGKIAGYYGSGAQGHRNRGTGWCRRTGRQTTGPRISLIPPRPRSPA